MVSLWKAMIGFTTYHRSALDELEVLTYLGGSRFDVIAGPVQETDGRLYLAGTTSSADFPGTSGGFQDGLEPFPTDGIVVSMDAGLSTVINATFIGGAAGQGSLFGGPQFNGNQGNALIQKLETAMQQLANSNINAAENRFQAFINQVNAFVNAGVLTPGQASSLTDAVTGTVIPQCI